MAYRKGNRSQMDLLPASIEDYVSRADPVRAYDALIDTIDLKSLGINLFEHKVGNSSYDPKVMLKILVYSYSYGWRSSRKIERALHHDLSFIWLSGDLKPDHKTISEFRRNNKKPLKLLLKQVARICMELDLIEGNSLFLDGSKIRGNCSINATRSKECCDKQLTKLDARIDEILTQCSKADNSESGNLVSVKKELQDTKKLKAKVEGIKSKIDELGVDKINTTDEEAINFKSRQGSHAGYNAQVVTDEKHGLIVSADVVNESNDFNQFSPQIEQANEILGENCKTATADAGYASIDDLKQTHDKGIQVIVPSQKQALHKKSESEFDKDKFKYDKESNCYICPANNLLPYSHHDKSKDRFIYRAKTSDCQGCKHFGKCTTNKRGRAIARLKNEDLKNYLEEQYIKGENQEIYKLRKSKVELQFGHIKRNLGAGYFLLRGLEKVKAEMGILASCFNIVRMINLIGGVEKMISKLSSLKTA